MTKEELDTIAENVIAQVVQVIPWSSEEAKDQFIRSGAKLFTERYRKDIPPDVISAVRAASITMVVISLSLKNLTMILKESCEFDSYLANTPGVTIDSSNFLDNLETLGGAARALMSAIEE